MPEESVKNPIISIVIPTLNMREDLIKCLNYLRKLDYPAKCMEITVWDNGSSDGTQTEVSHLFREMEKEDWRKLNLVQSKRNLGVYTSRDELFKCIAPDADYILSLDDDVFLPKESLTVLIKTLQSHPDAAIIGPRTVYESEQDETAHGAGFVNLWIGRFSDNNTNSKIECDFVIGCCMLIKREVISYLKGFDRDYYTSHGEVDFCLKAKKKGYKTFYDPGIIVRHNVEKGGTKTLERTYYLYRNKFLVIRKNATLLQKMICIPLYTIFWVPKMILDSIRFHRSIKPDELFMMFKAVGHAIINRVGKVDL